MITVPRIELRVETLLQWFGFAGILLFCLLIGFWCAVLPAAFVIKVSFFFAGVLVFVAGLLDARLRPSQVRHESPLRVTLLCWLFLLGACPAYLPFKLGSLPGLNPVRVSFLLMTGLWLYQIVASSQLRTRLRERLAVAPMLFRFFAAYSFWQMLSAVLADDVVPALIILFRGFGPILVAMVVLSVVRDWRDVMHLCYALCAGACVACGFGMIEWRTEINPFLRFFPTDSEQLEALQWIAADKYRGGVYRVAATFSHPLALGEFLSMCLPFAGVLVLIGKSHVQRLVGLALIGFSIPVIYLTYTRSALVAGGVSVVLYGTLVAIRAARNRKSLGIALVGWMSILIAVVGSVAIIGSALDLAKGRDAGERGSSLARVEMIDRAVRAVSERPLQGFGPGMGAIKAGIYAGGSHLTIDSQYLSVVVEHGLPGLLLYLCALGLAWLVAVRGSLFAVADPGRWILPAIAVSLTSSLIVKIVLSLTNNFELFYVLIALAVIGTQWVDAERVHFGAEVGAAS